MRHPLRALAATLILLASAAPASAADQYGNSVEDAAWLRGLVSAYERGDLQAFAGPSRHEGPAYLPSSITSFLSRPPEGATEEALETAIWALGRMGSVGVRREALRRVGSNGLADGREDDRGTIDSVMRGFLERKGSTEGSLVGALKVMLANPSERLRLAAEAALVDVAQGYADVALERGELAALTASYSEHISPAVESLGYLARRWYKDPLYERAPIAGVVEVLIGVLAGTPSRRDPEDSSRWAVPREQLAHSRARYELGTLASKFHPDAYGAACAALLRGQPEIPATPER